MTLQDILGVKGGDVFTIGPDATLAEVVDKLVEHNCGSLVVCDQSRPTADAMIGIITERDILRACAARRGSLGELLVRDGMTAKPVTGLLTDAVGHAMGVMTDHRIRHLPVLDQEKLVGLISIGDLVKAQHDQTMMENHYLKEYINR